MAKVSRIKQRLVRDLVQENLDLADGKAPARKDRGKGGTARRGWIWAGVVLPILAVTLVLATRSEGGALAAWLGGGPQPEAAVVAAPQVDEAALIAAAREQVEKEVAAELTRLRALEAAQEVEPEMVELAASAGTVVQQVLPLAVRRIVIDPGHGGEATGTKDHSGILEKEVVLDIGLRLRTLLEKHGFEVVMTREVDEDISLYERAKIANAARGDLFVSIHINWIADRKVRGIETYYLGASEDPLVNQLAAFENRGSGYSVADMRHLLDRIYSGVRISKSKRLAQEMQSSLYNSLTKINPKLIDRGVKSAPFVVLADTEMPAVLAEVSCMSNERESRLLRKPLYRQFIAESLARGIRSYSVYSDPAARISEPVEQKGS